MTEDRTPSTPGMAEVSTAFVHEPEAAVGGEASTDETLSTLWREHERLRQQYREAIKRTDLAFTASRAGWRLPGAFTLPRVKRCCLD